MPVISKGNTFATNQQVTATNLNNLVDNGSFVAGAADNTSTVVSGGAITVKDAGISTAKIADNAVTTGKLAAGVVNGLTTVTAASGDSIAIADVSDSGNVKKALVSDLYGAAFTGQLAFPATENASSNANTLDDYEEGTWTPSLGGTATYNSRTGVYTKIGRLVVAHCNIDVNTIGSGSSYLISGLPFTAAASTAGSVGRWSNAASNAVFMGCYATGTNVNMTATDASGANLNTIPNVFGNGTIIWLTVSYYV